MLFQDLQVLRRTIAETREAFVEQERAFVGLEGAVDSQSYEALTQETRELKETHRALGAERLALERGTDALRNDVAFERHRVEDTKAVVSALEAELRAELARRDELQRRAVEADRELHELRALVEPLTSGLEEHRLKVNRHKALLEKVIVDQDGYQSHLDSDALSGVKSGKPKRGAAGKRGGKKR